jgi:hypothetical protein
VDIDAMRKYVKPEFIDALLKKRDVLSEESFDSFFQIVTVLIERIDLNLLRSHDGRYEIYSGDAYNQPEMRLTCELVVDKADIQEVLISLEPLFEGASWVLTRRTVIIRSP